MNKAQVEGSISIGYIMDELPNSHHFISKKEIQLFHLRKSGMRFILMTLWMMICLKFSSLQVKQSVPKGNGI